MSCNSFSGYTVNQICGSCRPNLKPRPRLVMCQSLFLRGKHLVLQWDEEILDLKGINWKCFILTLTQCNKENGFDAFNPFGQLTRFRGNIFSIRFTFRLIDFEPQKKICVFNMQLLLLPVLSWVFKILFRSSLSQTRSRQALLGLIKLQGSV